MKTLFFLTLLILPVVAQDKPKTSDDAKKPAEYSLTAEELKQLQEFRDKSQILNERFKKINELLDSVLTDEAKISGWDSLVLARKQNAELQQRAQAWERDLVKKHKCPACVIQGDKFVEQLEKK